MTVGKMTALIKAGFGQAHRELYKAFLQVSKNAASPVSNVGLLDYPECYRLQHPRSRAEWNTFLLLRWLGAFDVRDAFPVWSFPHRHPKFGLDGCDDAPMVPGLTEVAGNDLDVGVFVGSAALPYVATLDALVTWRMKAGYRLMAVENKPWALVHQPDPLSRARARLELSRRYCKAANIPRLLVHGEFLHTEMVRNLDALRPAVKPEVLAAVIAGEPYADLIESLNSQAGKRNPMSETAAKVATKYRLGNRTRTLMLHMAVWRQDVDHDICMPLRLWEPPQPGGRAYRGEVLEQMMRAAR